MGIFANRKRCAYAIGIAKMSSRTILREQKGVAVEVLHMLNDGIWALDHKIGKTLDM